MPGPLDSDGATGANDSPAERWSPGRIGELVATHRQMRRLRVSELARRVGVTPSLISQIERGTSRPSVATLFALAEVLDVSVDVFADRAPAATRPAPMLHEPEPELPASHSLGERYMVKNGERRSIVIEGGVRWELLTPTPSPDLEFLELVYEPKAQSNSTLYQHPGAELVLVLEGRFEIHLGFERYELGTGDSICFPSSLPHRYVNPTDEVARAVTVILADGAAANL